MPRQKGSTTRSDLPKFHKGQSIASFGAWGRSDTELQLPIPAPFTPPPPVSEPQQDPPVEDAEIDGVWNSLAEQENTKKSSKLRTLFPNTTFFKESGRLQADDPEEELLKGQWWYEKINT